jgi:hypothetical protein
MREINNTKMDFLTGIVALLAFVVLVLTALTAWMYIQQTRIMQAVGALTAAVTAPPPSFFEAAMEHPVHEEEETVQPEVDDRVSVHEDIEQIYPAEDEPILPAAEEDDDLGGKTVAQLRELLTAKGIPFNKSDKKPTLVNLLKVAS